MMLFKRNAVRVLVAGLGLMAGAMAQAYDVETGLVKLSTFPTGTYDNELVMVRMASPDPMKSGACADNLMLLPLDGAGSQAVYSALLAANINGKSVAIMFENDSGNCTVLSADL